MCTYEMYNGLPACKPQSDRGVIVKISAASAPRLAHAVDLAGHIGGEERIHRRCGHAPGHGVEHVPRPTPRSLLRMRSSALAVTGPGSKLTGGG